MVDFVMQHATPMRRIIFPIVPCLPLPYLLYYFKYRSFFEKIKQRVKYGSCLSYKVCLKQFLLQEELTRYYDDWNYAFYKIPNMLVRFQKNLRFL